MPSRQWKDRMDSTSSAARSQSNVDRPAATTALSQLHWCGCRTGDGTVQRPVSLTRRTRRAPPESAPSVTGEADQQASDVLGRVLQVDQADVLVRAVRQ